MSATTIRNWTREFSDFFSQAAAPGRDSTRQFTDDDMAIIQTIAVLRQQSKEFDEISAVLADGKRLEPMPAVDDETAETETKAVSVVDAFQSALTSYQNRVGELEGKVDELQDRLMASEVARATAETRLEILDQQQPEETPVKAEPSWWERFRGKEAQ